MTQITEIPNTPWRDRLRPASFRNVQFHVEAASQESGRRIVVHEFPKRNVPYSEDMGRIAVNFTVRAYIIAYPFNTGRPLYQRNYMIPRDALIAELEREGAGTLQLPLLPPMQVVAQKYRITEETKLGGYCTFDITFTEAGKQIAPEESTREIVEMAALGVNKRTILVMDNQKTQTIAVRLVQ